MGEVLLSGRNSQVLSVPLSVFHGTQEVVSKQDLCRIQINRIQLFIDASNGEHIYQINQYWHYGLSTSVSARRPHANHHHHHRIRIFWKIDLII